MHAINILYGVVWLFGGLVWLRRAMANKARPSASTFSLTEPETETDGRRKWGRWLTAALYVMLGVLYLLKGIFSHQY